MTGSEDPRDTARRIVAEVLASREGEVEPHPAPRQVVDADLIDVERHVGRQDRGRQTESREGAEHPDHEDRSSPRAVARRIVVDVLRAEEARQAQAAAERVALVEEVADVEAPSLPERVQDLAEPEGDSRSAPDADDVAEAGPPGGPEPDPDDLAELEPHRDHEPYPDDLAELEPVRDLAPEDLVEPEPSCGPASDTDDVEPDVVADTGSWWPPQSEPSLAEPLSPGDSLRRDGDAMIPDPSEHADVSLLEWPPADLAEPPTAPQRREPPRTGRWLLTTILAALALAWLFPMAVAALRDLVAL